MRIPRTIKRASAIVATSVMLASFGASAAFADVDAAGAIADVVTSEVVEPAVADDAEEGIIAEDEIVADVLPAIIADDEEGDVTVDVLPGIVIEDEADEEGDEAVDVLPGSIVEDTAAADDIETDEMCDFWSQNGRVWTAGDHYVAGEQVLHQGNIWERTITTNQPSTNPPAAGWFSAWRLIGPVATEEVPCTDITPDRPLPTPDEVPSTVPDRPLPNGMCEFTDLGDPAFSVWEGRVWTWGQFYVTGERVLHNGDIWERTITTNWPSTTVPAPGIAWRFVEAFVPEVSFPDSVTSSVPCIEITPDRPLPTPDENTGVDRPFPAPDCDSEAWLALCTYSEGDRVVWNGITYQFARGFEAGNEIPGLRNDGLWMEEGATVVNHDGQEFQLFTSSWIYDADDMVVYTAGIWRAVADDIREIAPSASASPLTRVAYHWEFVGAFGLDTVTPDVITTLPEAPATVTPEAPVVAAPSGPSLSATGASIVLPVIAAITTMAGGLVVGLRRQQSAK